MAKLRPRKYNNYFKLVVLLIVLFYPECGESLMKTPDDYPYYRSSETKSELPTPSRIHEQKEFDSESENSRIFRNDFPPEPKVDNSDWKFVTSEKPEPNQKKKERSKNRLNLEPSSVEEELSFRTQTGQKRLVTNRQEPRSFEATFDSSESRQRNGHTVSKITSFSEEEDSLAKETERNSRGVPSVPGSFGPEPYFLNDDGEDNFGNKGRSNFKNGQDDKFLSFDQGKDNRKRNENIPQKFSLIPNPDSFSSMVNQRKAGNSGSRSNNGAQLIKMIPETSRDRGSGFNSHTGNAFGHDVRNKGKQIGNIKSFDSRSFQDNSKTIKPQDSRFLSITTAPPFRIFDDAQKPSNKNQKKVENILKLLNIKSNENINNNNNNNRQNQNGKILGFENFNSGTTNFKDSHSRQSSENIKKNSREDFTEYKNSKLARDNNVKEFRNDRNRDQNYEDDFNREQDVRSSRVSDSREFRNNRNRETQDFRDSEESRNKNRGSHDSRNGRISEQDFDVRDNKNREHDSEFRNQRNRNSQEIRTNRNNKDRDSQEFREDRLRDQQSFSNSKNRNTKERFENGQGKTFDSRESRDRKKSKSQDSKGDRDRNLGFSKDFDSARHRDNNSPGFRNKENDRKNRDYDSSGKDYDFDDSSPNYKNNRDYDSSGSGRDRDYDSRDSKREKGNDSRFNRYQDYDSSGFKKNNNDDSRDSRKNNGKSKRPSKSKENFRISDRDLPPLNFESLLDSFEERDRGRNFPGKKKSKSQDVDDLLDFIHGAGGNSDKSFGIEDFDEIVKNLNDDPNFLSNLGFTFVNASELPLLIDNNNNNKGNKGNKNKGDSPLSLFETLVNLKDPKIKNGNLGSSNFNGNKNNDKDKNKQSLSDLLSSFKLNTKPGGDRTNQKQNARQKNRLDQESNLRPNADIRIGSKDNNLFSTIRPQSFRHVTEGSNKGDGKTPYSLRPTKIPNSFGSSTPGGGSFGTTEVTSVFGNGQDYTSEEENGNTGNINPPFRMSQGGAPVFINSTVFVSTTALPPFLSPIDYIPRLRTPSSLPPNIPGSSQGNIPGYTYHVLPGGQNFIPGLNAISNKGLFGVNNPLVNSRLQAPTRAPGLVTSTLFPAGKEQSGIPTTTPFPTSPHHSTPFSPTHRPTLPFSAIPQPTPFSVTPFPGSANPTRPGAPFSLGPGHTTQFTSTPFPTTPFSVTPRPITPRSNTPFTATHRTTPFSVTPRPTSPFSAIPNPTSPHSVSPQARVSFPDNQHSSFPTSPRPSQPFPTFPVSVGSNPSTPFSVTPHPTTPFSASPFPTTFLPGTIGPNSFPTTLSPGSPFPINSQTTPFSPHSFPTSIPHGVNFNQGFSRPSALPIVTSEAPAKTIPSNNQDNRQDLKSLTARGRRLRGRAREGLNKGLTPVISTASSTTTTTEPSVTLRTVPPNFAVRRRLRKKVKRKKKRINANNHDQELEEVHPTPTSPHVRSSNPSDLDLNSPHNFQRQEHSRILRKIPVGRSVTSPRENQILRHGDQNFITSREVNIGHANIPNTFVTPTPFGPFVTTPTPFGLPNLIARTTPAPHLRTIAPATLEHQHINPFINKVTASPRGKSLTVSPTPFITTTFNPQHSPFARNTLLSHSGLGPNPSAFPLSRLQQNPQFNNLPSSVSSPHSQLHTRPKLFQKDIDTSFENVGNLKRFRRPQFSNQLPPNALHRHAPRVPLTATPFHSTVASQLNTPHNQPVLITSPRPALTSTIAGPRIKSTHGSESLTASPRPKFRKGTPTPVPLRGSPLSHEIEETPIQEISDIPKSAEIPDIPKGINPNIPLYPHHHHLSGIPRVPLARLPPGYGPYLSPYGPALFDPRAQNLTHQSFVHPSLRLGPSLQGLHSPGPLIHGSSRGLPSHLGPGPSSLLYPNNLIPYPRGSYPLGGQQPGSYHLGGQPPIPGGSPGLGLRKYYVGE